MIFAGIADPKETTDLTAFLRQIGVDGKKTTPSP
jgi:hypothetical protein